MSAKFDEYPKWMRHPAERPAVVSDDYASGERQANNALPGRPLRFPPVMVNNADQESYHKAQGYAPVNGDPTAYLKATIAPEPKGYVHNEYPKLLADGSIDLGPDAPPPPDNFYPYWVRMEGYEPTLVEDREEHQALLEARGSSKNEPVREPSDTEAECMAAILAASGEGETETPAAPRRGRPRKVAEAQT